MAKNKKPRKQYHKRWRTQKLICDQKEVDAIKETFSDVELAVEMKLPRGLMSMQDVQELRDMLNLSTVLMFHGYGIVRKRTASPRAVCKMLSTPTTRGPATKAYSQLLATS